MIAEADSTKAASSIYMYWCLGFCYYMPPSRIFNKTHGMSLEGRGFNGFDLEAIFNLSASGRGIFDLI